MSRRNTWVLVVVIAVATVGSLGWFKVSQIRAAIAYGESFPEPSETIYVAPARSDDWQPVSTATGEVVARRTVDVIAEYPGTIVTVGYAPAADVEGGQLLIGLDTREEQAALDSARAAAELARLTLERNESLRQTSAVSAQATDTARAELAQSLAEIRRLETVIDKKRLRAPFAARTDLHDWQPGQYVEAGRTVARLVGLADEVWVDFALPQELASLVNGDTVRLARQTPEVAAVAGRIVARQPFVDERARTVTYRAAFPADDALPAGAFVSVEVPVGTPRTAVRVPATAVRRDAFGTHVFVLNPAEAGADAPLRAERRAVDVLEIGVDTAWLAGGVEPGEQVAGDGAFKLRDGLLARSAGS